MPERDSAIAIRKRAEGGLETVERAAAECRALRGRLSDELKPGDVDALIARLAVADEAAAGVEKLMSQLGPSREVAQALEGLALERNLLAEGVRRFLGPRWQSDGLREALADLRERARAPCLASWDAGSGVLAQRSFDVPELASQVLERILERPITNEEALRTGQGGVPFQMALSEPKAILEGRVLASSKQSTRVEARLFRPAVSALPVVLAVVFGALAFLVGIPAVANGSLQGSSLLCAVAGLGLGGVGAYMWRRARSSQRDAETLARGLHRRLGVAPFAPPGRSVAHQTPR